MEIMFYPTSETARDFPPLPMKKTIPDWYKNVPAEFGSKTAEWMVDNNSETPHTIKKCVPVLDYLTSGYTLRTQTEILLSVKNNDGNQALFWKFPSNDQSTVSYHPHSQCPVKIQGEEKVYVKIGCGFVVKTPPGYSCIFYQSPFSMEKGLELFSAIVDTDVYDGEIFFPGYITAGYNHLILPPGAPLITVFPFKRESWNATVSTTIVPASGVRFQKIKRVWLSEVYHRFFRQPKEYR